MFAKSEYLGAVSTNRLYSLDVNTKIQNELFLWKLVYLTQTERLSVLLIIMLAEHGIVERESPGRTWQLCICLQTLAEENYPVSVLICVKSENKLSENRIACSAVQIKVPWVGVAIFSNIDWWPYIFTCFTKFICKYGSLQPLVSIWMVGFSSKTE